MKRVQLSLTAFLVSLMAVGLAFAAQTQPESQQGIGQVTASGDVTLNGMPLPGVTTLYPGSRLRTGPRSAAAVSVPGRGQFLLGEGSEATFPSSRGNYFTQLLSGSATLKVEAGQGLDALAGRFLITVRPAEASSIELAFQPDGTILVRGQAGTGLAIDLDGAESISLSLGSCYQLFASGRIVACEQNRPGASQTSGSKEPLPTGDTKKLPLILLLLGATGAGVGTWLALRGEESTPRP